MGITIHYRGKIDRINDVAQLSTEIKEYADILQWDSRQWKENWNLPNSAALEKNKDGLALSGHIPIRGISLFPDPNCEPLFLTFCRDGTMASSMNMVIMAEKDFDSDGIWLSTKTQFASTDIHISIIKLLRFVKSKYVSDLEVRDDGRYWESGDAANLEERFQRIGAAIDSLPGALNLIPQKELKNKTPEEIADFIENMIKRKFGK
ncbi:hypothetical protein [Rhodohalobacter sp. 8-1]|uniref:hypothetical protein n=1 Tax=Rhodohalobacter sp. 8-1 TaxID=3131972 RepID=UPI0030EF6466